MFSFVFHVFLERHLRHALRILIFFLKIGLQLTDLCILDIGCMEHTYSQLAAAALYHLTSREMVLSVTGNWPFHSEDKT